MDRNILGVWAHPDDEQFGTAGAMRRCIERGIKAYVLCATSGDAGEISDPALATKENLAEVREQELRDACAIIGFEEPILLRHGDGKLSDVPFEQLTGEVVRVIRKLKPGVVVTFDHTGGYGHPDHIAIHHATTAAVTAAADGEYRPDLGTPHRVAKLYYGGFSKSRRRRMDELLTENGFPPLDFGTVQTIRNEDMGTPDELITTRVPVGDLFELRFKGLLAHRTQFGADSLFRKLPESAVREMVNEDNFVRVFPAPAPGTVLPDEHDLWTGLD